MAITSANAPIAKPVRKAITFFILNLFYRPASWRANESADHCYNAWVMARPATRATINLPRFGPALFTFFLASGFCSLVYEIVWLRLAYASFGVNTQVMSVVISVFMAGLAIGSWLGGSIIDRLSRGISPLFYYAAAEAVIGIGGLTVPILFRLGQRILLAYGPADSAPYLMLSGLLLAVFLFPWCVAMGTTFPFAMAFMRKDISGRPETFSFLYLANVIGAMLGAISTALIWVELAGFTGTLRIASAINFLIAVSATLLAIKAPYSQAQVRPPSPASNYTLRGGRSLLSALFITGFTSMGMEVAWVRNFTPVLGNQIYSFAILLTVYLLATWLGSATYRRAIFRGHKTIPPSILSVLAGLFSLFPVLLTDPRLNPDSMQVLASLMPFCFILGYLTPSLIDKLAQGDPASTGRAYALNILGCILGPLTASYLLLPFLGVQASLTLLAIPYLAVFPWLTGRKSWKVLHWTLSSAFLLALGFSGFASYTFENAVGWDHPPVKVIRDYSATTVACGENSEKRLYVNGIILTRLTPVTKVMAHLPLFCLPHRPQNGVVICFGMGTTFRSMASWGIDTTAVELIPGVRDFFGYFYPGESKILNSPGSRVVIDDGRRFLMRTKEMFDVVTIDPPPPVEAAASSLLYSREFYIIVKSRLKPGGIFQQWMPPGEIISGQATLRALVEVFTHVRVFRGIGGKGEHFLASESPIILPNEETIKTRMPDSARKDLVEWPSLPDFHVYCTKLPKTELPINSLLNPDHGVVLTDNSPVNEYFFLRRMKRRLSGLPALETTGPWFK